MPHAVASILVVDPQGEAMADALRQKSPQLDVLSAATETAARAYLGASAFDVVVVGASMPDEMAETLGQLIETLGHPTQIVSGAPADDFASWAARQFGLEDAPVLENAAGDSDPDAHAALKEVSAELSRIAHALNNPLAVIDGNAQLALELARALGTDASVIAAIEDIQNGSQNLAALFAELVALRARVDTLIR